MRTKELRTADLGATTFFAASHPPDGCGSNGLPLTPNSIVILGKFQALRTLSHPNIVSYVDIVRGKHERLMVVSEHHQFSLAAILKERNEPLNEQETTWIARGCLQGLSYLHHHGIIHRNLHPRNILLAQKGDVKLSEYGLYHMTDNGRAVFFPIGNFPYMAPEVIASEGKISGPQGDIWSIGMILLQAFLGNTWLPSASVKNWCYRILELTGDVEKKGTLERILDQWTHGQNQNMNDLQRDFFNNCLSISPSSRSEAGDLLLHGWLEIHGKQEMQMNGFVSDTCSCFSILELPSLLRNEPHPEVEELLKKIRAPVRAMVSPGVPQTLLPSEYPGTASSQQHSEFLMSDHLSGRSLEEIYHLWQLAGGDVSTELKKQGLIRSKPPILSLPKLAVEEGKLYGESRDQRRLYSSTVVILPLEQLRSHLSHVDPKAYHPLIEYRSQLTSKMGDSPPSSFEEMQKLPLAIREADAEYQLHRLILFRQLLQGYPYKRRDLMKEAQVDIPPLYRGHVWAAILDVKGDIQSKYACLDKTTPTFTDRQIEVDIPRCHQYNKLLSSPTGHEKFKPLAYACLSAFIDKYLHNFFLKENARIIHEYLAKFSHLMAFHDPILFSHLQVIGFEPELYAIPWFLTMFTHVLPLGKIMHLWDTLLLGSSSFPLCVGLALISQLRESLLSFAFNDCILLFSDLPEIDMQKCVEDSKRIFCTTPPSILFRVHGKKPGRLYGLQTYDSSVTPHSVSTPALGPEYDMDEIPVEVLKREPSPRISAADLICLLGLTTRNDHSPPGSPEKLLPIDIRSPDEFNRGCIPGSVNIPFHTAFGADKSLNPCMQVDVLNSYRGRILVMVGNKDSDFPVSVICCAVVMQMVDAMEAVRVPGFAEDELLLSSG
ncbi:unnamed protein product [Darwinula stevensoni]|uniref:non-specific serine/threonine protein kinase n=1 Tax=Darwinula stevensoni TaxID=69355 RepID=A0A7R8XJV9_9CRUS|nr:unnamed protein product [Darwinula stevensoni]CAG0894600.1 unnamed protein product [Darwinula stevensoni]